MKKKVLRLELEDLNERMNKTFYVYSWLFLLGISFKGFLIFEFFFVFFYNENFIV